MRLEPDQARPIPLTPTKPSPSYTPIWRIFMQCRRIHWNFFGNRLSLLLSFGRLKLYFGSYANRLFLCYVCFCAPHLRLDFERRQFCTTALIFMLTLSVWSWLLTRGSLKSYETKYINFYWTKSNQHPRLCNALNLQNNLKVWSSTPSLFLLRK